MAEVLGDTVILTIMIAGGLRLAVTIVRITRRALEALLERSVVPKVRRAKSGK